MYDLVERPAEIPCPTSDEVREHLRTLLSRGEFSASERNRRFLSYVVEETLHGRADRIKAYNIALAAFERSEDFDPLNDPIVRIEAGRLRRSLEHYYLTDGRTDRIRISIPKGSYAAAFSYADDVASPAPMLPPPVADIPVKSTTPVPVAGVKRTWRFTSAIAAALVLLLAVGAGLGYWGGSFRDRADNGLARGASVIVLPFEDISKDASRSFVARGMTYEIIASLTRYSDISVIGPETSFAIGGAEGLRQASNEIQADFVLSGSVQSDGDRIRISAILSDAKTSRSFWSRNIDRSLTTASILELERQIADEVAGAIGQPYGIAYDHTVDTITTKPTASLTSYECVVKFRRYWRHYDQGEFSGVRACLEQTVARDPGYGAAYASLALVYVDSYRFGFGRDEIDFEPLSRALDLALRAMELDSQSVDSFLSLSMAYWFSKQIDKSLQVAQRGLEINPGSSELLADLGYHYVLMENWDKGMPLVAAAYERDPEAPTGYRLSTFMYAIMHEDYQTALDAALKVEAPYVLYGHLARAIAYARLGRDAEAAREYAEVLKVDPRYTEHARSDLSKRIVSAEIVQSLVDGIELAATAHARLHASN